MPRDLAAMMRRDQEPKDKTSRDMEKQDHLAGIKPYVQTLTISDVDSAVKLEDATFPPEERATKEKFEYRFTKCGGLCLGLFTSVDMSDSSSPLASVETASSAHHVYSGAPARKSVLLAHCVVTKTTNSTVMDEDMEIPDNWKTSSALTSKVGHKEKGRTVAVHSLAVLPSLQSQGLGSTLLKAFVQRLGYVQAADRVALLAHGDLVKFYEKLGFENKGPSKATFGGGNWVDMVLDLNTSQK
ncbi:acyl-CoA N-acyltransferase [Aureobasidium subglaciale]|nr:acyl-CoA N-acyltransferase [Aureobasidium subglaciale]